MSHARKFERYLAGLMQACRRVTVLTRVSVLLVSAAWAVSCGGTGRQAEPRASLASSVRAERDLEPIRRAWASNELERAPLERFLAAHPRDGAVSLVRVYLAFFYLREGHVEQAERELLRVAKLPPGATRDLATVATARCLRHRGEYDRALELLRPLSGKLVDDADKATFFEEISLAALAAKDEYEALAYLDAWLQGVSVAERDGVRRVIEGLVEGLDRQVLEQTYRTMQSPAGRGGYGPDTRRIVAARLGRIAVETHDAALARWIVETSSGTDPRRRSSSFEDLGELAASRRGVTKVSGRMVGLVLPPDRLDMRDEAAEVVRGSSWALDLPRLSTAEGGVRLVTREEGPTGIDAALGELAGEGASILLGGFDRQSAEKMAAWSAEHGVPVLLLAAPASPVPAGSRAWVLGEPVEREVEMLVEAATVRGEKIAIVTGAADIEARLVASCEGRDVFFVPCQSGLFPAESLLRERPRSVIVAAGAACARTVVRDLAQKPIDVFLSLGASVSEPELPTRSRVYGASSGALPVGVAEASDAVSADVRAYQARFGGRPTYWTALGHDAAALAKASLAALPTDTTTTRAEVERRHAIAHESLASAQAMLWSADTRGFAADGRVDRSVRLVTIRKTR